MKHSSSFPVIMTRQIVNRTFNLNTSKYTGPSSILTKVIKQIMHVTSVPTKIKKIDLFWIVCSLIILKKAKVIPIFKGKSRTTSKFDRPIHLLSNIGNVTEKLMHKRLYNLLKSQFLSFQFSYLLVELCSIVL